MSFSKGKPLLVATLSEHVVYFSHVSMMRGIEIKFNVNFFHFFNLRTFSTLHSRFGLASHYLEVVILFWIRLLIHYLRKEKSLFPCNCWGKSHPWCVDILFNIWKSCKNTTTSKLPPCLLPHWILPVSFFIKRIQLNGRRRSILSQQVALILCKIGRIQHYFW